VETHLISSVSTECKRKVDESLPRTFHFLIARAQTLRLRLRFFIPRGSLVAACSLSTLGHFICRFPWAHDTLPDPANKQQKQHDTRVKMSTHFRPRTATAAPPSPVRPSTARSTIRAITPSPPPSLSEALRLDYATSGTPNYGAADTPGKNAAVRLKSEGVYHLTGFSGGEEPYAKYIQTAEDGTFPSSPTEGITNGMEVKTGGGMLGRSSPVKRSSRSKSPKKKRPYSTPTLPSPQEVPSHDREEEQSGRTKDDDDESETDADCPDTPTPMTTSQKRSAYVPLGTPTPLPYPKRSPKPKDSPQSPQTPEEASATPNTLSASKPHNEEEPKEVRLMPHPYSHLKPSDFDDLDGGSPRNIHKSNRILLDQAKYNDHGYHEQAPSSEYYDQTGDMYYRHDQDGEAMRFPSQAQNHDQPTSSQPQYLQQPQQQPLPRKPLPSATIARHISISGTSNISGGTATSKKSVFSTPGRDELERKKALVEADEGPFARVVSVADLNASRRVISGEMPMETEGGGKGVRERMSKKVDEGKEKVRSRGCGMGEVCAVM
jgi:hypothetical protein